MLSVTGPPKKRKRIENIMEDFVNTIAVEKKEKKKWKDEKQTEKRYAKKRE